MIYIILYTIVPKASLTDAFSSALFTKAILTLPNAIQIFAKGSPTADKAIRVQPNRCTIGINAIHSWLGLVQIEVKTIRINLFASAIMPKRACIDADPARLPENPYRFACGLY
jgi:hypothetical protein